MLGAVCTTEFARRFLKQKTDLRYFYSAEEERKPITFNEEQILEFLEQEFAKTKVLRTSSDDFFSKQYRKSVFYIKKSLALPRFFYRRCLGLLCPETYHHIKKAFICYLISHHLVTSPKVINFMYEFDTIAEDKSDSVE